MSRTLSIVAVVCASLLIASTAQAVGPTFGQFQFSQGTPDGNPAGWPAHTGTAPTYLNNRAAALAGTLTNQTLLQPEETCVWPDSTWDYGGTMVWLNTIKDVPADALIEVRYTTTFTYPAVNPSEWWADGVLFDSRSYYVMDSDHLGSGDKASSYALEYWQETGGSYTFARADWLYNLTEGGGTANNPPDLSEVYGSTYHWIGEINVYTGEYTFDDSQGTSFRAVYAHFGEEDPWGTMQPSDPGSLVTGGTVCSTGSLDMQFTVVPEPASVVLLVGGVAGLFWLRRRAA